MTPSDEPEISDSRLASLQLLNRRLDEITEQVNSASLLQDRMSDQIAYLEEGVHSLAEVIQAAFDQTIRRVERLEGALSLMTPDLTSLSKPLDGVDQSISIGTAAEVPQVRE